MSPTSFALVMAAAAMHAGWNATLKAGGDRLVTMWAIVCAAAILNLPIIVVVGLPRRSVWWILGVTALLHIAYNLFLVAAYERADLAVAYPIARGTAPVLVTIGGIVLLGDRVGPLGLVGVGLITAGLVLVATSRPAKDTRWAIATGVMIALYTLVDGYGVRRNGDAVQFIALSFVIYGAALSVIVARRRSIAVLRSAAWTRPGMLLGAGGMNAGAYLLVMIAARTEPLGLVSGLRETSSLFGLLIASVILHERVTGRQSVAIVAAVAGAVAIAW